MENNDSMINEPGDDPIIPMDSSSGMPADGLEDSAPQEERGLSMRRRVYLWLWDVLLIGVLILGAYFRFFGIGWDEGSHMHPDERFLTMVGSSIHSVNSLGDYFNTASSS